MTRDSTMVKIMKLLHTEALICRFFGQFFDKVKEFSLVFNHQEVMLVGVKITSWWLKKSRVRNPFKLFFFRREGDGILNIDPIFERNLILQKSLDFPGINGIVSEFQFTFPFFLMMVYLYNSGFKTDPHSCLNFCEL